MVGARGLRRPLSTAIAGVLATALLADPAVAHAGSFGTTRTAPIPSWLVIGTGVGVVGASFLFTSLLTDRTLVEAVPRRARSSQAVRWLAPFAPPARTLLRWAAVGVVVVAVAVGIVGPESPRANLLTLGVWIVWWAGYTATTYLVGNSWPAVNPWRTVASVIPSERRSLPDSVGVWPSVVGLLALVTAEVSSPLAADSRLLALAVGCYSAVTVGGAVVFGDAWFERVDPVARTFRYYGLLAPVRRSGTGLDLALPGTGLIRESTVYDRGEVAFVIALVWATTFDGLVSTAAWGRVATAAAGVGVPRVVLTLLALGGGFGCFAGLYWLAARAVRRTAPTYVTTRYLAGWFAPALIPIAAGYHLAHFAGYLLSFAPTVLSVAAAPLAPPAALTVLSLPPWFGAVQIIAVVVGHVVAVWVAHARAFALFAGRVQPVRSQYPFAAVAVCYTATSLWIVAQPTAAGLA
jgi:hypothetical protein